MGTQITRDSLARMYPRALPDWIDALERLAPMLLDHYRFTRLDWVGICGQIDAETDGLALKCMQEDMRFTAPRMLEVYSKRLGDCVGIPVPPLGGRTFASKGALARALAGNPTAIADCVYGGPRGREGTPPWCGSRYIGRGPLQETHLNNYRDARDEIRRQPGGTECPDLVEHPELLASDPELGIRNVFGQWQTKGLYRYAQDEAWETLSDALNTGNIHDSVKPFGLARRLRATARAIAIWPADAWTETHPDQAVDGHDKSGVAYTSMRALKAGDTGDDVRELQDRLSELGFATGPSDGTFGVLTTRAIVALQAEHGLKADGVVGPRTRAVMDVTAPAPGSHNEITASDLTSSTTVRAAQRIKTLVGAVFAGAVATGADQEISIGLVDGIVAKGEQVKGLIGRVNDLGIPVPSGPTIAVLAVCAGCVVLWRLASKVECGRVQAARRGG